MRFLSNSLCALSIFGISKIPTHCWKKASVTWPFSASGLLSMKIVFYLPVNTDKPKLIAVLVFFFLNDCLIYRSNFVFRKCHENSFLPTSKHWQAKINRCLGFFFLNDCLIHRSNFVFRKCLETRRHLGSGSKTVNSQGYSELQEPIKTRENCYSLIW